MLADKNNGGGAVNKREWLIALPVLAGLAACIAGYLHGIQVENSFDGIVAMRAVETPKGARVGVVAARALHVLDGTGQRIARQDLKSLGLDDSPNDLDLTLAADGTLEAWLFEDGDAGPRVMRCAWSEELRRMDRCAQAAAGAQLKWSERSRAVHLAVDRAGQRMFVADAQGGRVQVFTLAGQRIATTEPEAVPLFYPNRLRYLGNDRLAVADNDHKRLAWLELRPGAAPRLVSTLFASVHPQSRSSRTKVTDAAFGASGSLWMLAVKQGQKDGDVLVFDAQQRPVARAQLPDGADPLVLESIADTALVADYSLVMVYRLDAQGRYLGEFGDAAFRADLVPMRELAAQSRWWTTGSLVAGGIVIVAGLLLGWRFSEKPVPKVLSQLRAALEGGADAPAIAFPVVLEPTPQYLEAMRKQAWLLGAGALAAGAFMAFMLLQLPAANLRMAWEWGAWLVLGSAVSWVVIRDTLRPPQLRVTASRAGLFRDGRCLAEATLDEVYASDRVIVLGRKWVLYLRARSRGRDVPPLYDLGLLRRALLQRIPEANLLDAAALQQVLVRRQPLWRKVAAVTAMVALVAWALRDFLPL
jgi:hypothetical protein